MYRCQIVVDRKAVGRFLASVTVASKPYVYICSINLKAENISPQAVVMDNFHFSQL